ncbi:SidA/IucD/PvdA family monooxygenase [bacterium]|nr:SidA/IucD/PvdA family monooxygenase [bacterium]
MAPMTESRNPLHIAIIGAGFSGVVTACQIVLQRLAPPADELTRGMLKANGGLRPVSITLYDPAEVGGSPYRDAAPEHPTNIPIGRMSAFLGNSRHLLEWLNETADKTDWPEEWREKTWTLRDFLPRSLYRLYIQSLLSELQHYAWYAGANVQLAESELAHLEVDENNRSALLTLAPAPEGANPILAAFESGAGTMEEADLVVLATGHTDAPLPGFVQESAAASPRLISHAYKQYDRFASIAPDESVLIIGTGLSAMDALRTLARQGHRGPVYLCSRHGSMHHPYPEGHQPHVYPMDNIDEARFLLHVTTADGLKTWLDSHLAKGTQQGMESEYILLAAQQPMADCFRSLPQPEQEAFLSRYAGWLNAKRIGMPTDMEAVMNQLDIRIITMNANSLEHDGGRFVLKGSHSANNLQTGVYADHAILATGLHLDYARQAPDWLRELMENGTVMPHHLGMGIEVNHETGRVKNADGALSHVLYAVGVMRLGATFEHTGMLGVGQGVPELRRQAYVIGDDFKWLSSLSEYPGMSRDQFEHELHQTPAMQGMVDKAMELELFLQGFDEAALRSDIARVPPGMGDYVIEVAVAEGLNYDIPLTDTIAQQAIQARDWMLSCGIQIDREIGI